MSFAELPVDFFGLSEDIMFSVMPEVGSLSNLFTDVKTRENDRPDHTLKRNRMTSPSRTM